MFHICVLAQIQNQTQSWSNSLSCIFHLDTPSSHSILSPAWSAEKTYLECHRFGSVEGYGGSSSSAGFLSVIVPVYCTFFFFLLTNGQHSPMYISLLFAYCFCGFFKTIAWGMAATLCGMSAFSILTAGVSVGGICQDIRASNRFMEAGMVLAHGVSSLTWKVETLGIASGCCLCWGVLQQGAEEFSSTLGLPVR